MISRRTLSIPLMTGDRFLSLPYGAQALYIQLNLTADDEGLIGSVRGAARSTGLGEDSVEALVREGFLIRFPSGVYALAHWHVNNAIRRDRCTPSVYLQERGMLELDEAGVYHLSQETGAEEEGGACRNDGGACRSDGGACSDDGGACSDDGGACFDDGGAFSDDGGASPTGARPENIRPYKTMTVKTMSGKAMTDRTVPDRAMTGRTVSARAVKGRTGPGKAGPARTGSRRKAKAGGDKGAWTEEADSFGGQTADAASGGRAEGCLVPQDLCAAPAPAAAVPSSAIPPLIPDRAEVENEMRARIAIERLYADPCREAARFYDYYARRKWRMPDGLPVHSWRSLVQSWVRRIGQTEITERLSGQHPADLVPPDAPRM